MQRNPFASCFFVLIMPHQKVLFCHVCFCIKNLETAQYNLSKNVYFQFSACFVFLLLSNNTLHVMFYTYICYWNTFQYKYIIQITFDVAKQSRARVTSKDIFLLFVILFFCLFLYCLGSFLFHEALLLLHCLNGLMCSNK